MAIQYWKLIDPQFDLHFTTTRWRPKEESCVAFYGRSVGEIYVIEQLTDVALHVLRV